MTVNRSCWEYNCPRAAAVPLLRRARLLFVFLHTGQDEAHPSADRNPLTVGISMTGVGTLFMFLRSTSRVVDVDSARSLHPTLVQCGSRLSSAALTAGPARRPDCTQRVMYNALCPGNGDVGTVHRGHRAVTARIGDLQLTSVHRTLFGPTHIRFT